MVAPKGTSDSKYEAAYTLAKLGFKLDDIVNMKFEDVKVEALAEGSAKGKPQQTMTIKGTKLDLDQAKTIAAYIADNAHNIVLWLFFGMDSNTQLSPKSFRSLFGRYLRRHYNISIGDLGWTSKNTTAPRPPIETMNDIAKILENTKIEQ